MMVNQGLNPFQVLFLNAQRYLGEESIVLEGRVNRNTKEFHSSDCFDYANEAAYLSLQEAVKYQVDEYCCWGRIEFHMMKDYLAAKAKPGGLHFNYLTSVSSVDELEDFLTSFRLLEDNLNNPKVSLEKELKELKLHIFAPGDDRELLDKIAFKSLASLIDETAKQKAFNLAKEIQFGILMSQKKHFGAFSPSRKQAVLELFEQELKDWEEGREECCLVRSSSMYPGSLKELVMAFENLHWGQIKRLPSWLASFISIDETDRVSFEEVTPEIMKIVEDLKSSKAFEDKTLRDLIQLAQAL